MRQFSIFDVVSTEGKYACQGKNIALVIPSYKGINNKQFHHKFFPNGLFKLSTYFKNQENHVELLLAPDIPSKYPDMIFITSLFTYWRNELINSIQFYKTFYPSSRIVLGGVDASLNPEYFENELGVEVFKGTFFEIESVLPDYETYFQADELDYQTLRISAGCIRACKPCGAHRIDPVYWYKPIEVIIHEITGNIEKNDHLRKIVFKDNSILAHPQAKQLFRWMSTVKIRGKVLGQTESQCGFDARILIEDYEECMAAGLPFEETFFYLLKKARFISCRIAWDNGKEEEEVVRKAIELFEKAGYPRKEIQVFMLYNFDYPYEFMEYKRKKVGEFGAQVSDCRYRPLDSTRDAYNSRRDSQTSEDYFIHELWTDEQIRTFRRNCRAQNIMIRFLNKNKPIIKDIFRVRRIPEKILLEFCRKYTWQESSMDPINQPLCY